MATIRVTAEQFEWRQDGPRKVLVHVPTGSTFAPTYNGQAWTREGDTGQDWRWMEISEFALLQILKGGVQVPTAGR